MIIEKALESLDLTGWLVFIFVVLLVTDMIRNRTPANFPPGPRPLPILGNVFTGVDFKTMTQLSEEYGPVFSLRKGSERIVFVSSFKMVKEALINQQDSFADRPIIPLFDVIFKGLGISLSNGYLWKMQRRFANTHLRQFGGGKKTLERYIEQESSFLLEAFKEEKGKPFNPHFLLKNAVGNIISCVVFGHRFEYGDEKYQNILRLNHEAILLSGTARAQLYDAFPTLFSYLPGPHHTVHFNYRAITHFLRNEVELHQKNWDPEDPRDFIDTYLTEIGKRTDDPQAGFNIETLVICEMDLIEAGTETAATTLRWALVYMMNYPEIQEKVQAEIDRVIGQSRQPNMADRPHMPYTDAVIHEIQRIGNIAPLGFPKMTSKDTTLGGYFIPKGTAIITNLSTVLFDKNEWETPDSFNPGHFLDSQGHFRKREAFMPFSAGRRVCLGENLARMELFLFFTSMLQRFTFSPPPGGMPSMEGLMGFTYSPQEFLVEATLR